MGCGASKPPGDVADPPTKAPPDSAGGSKPSAPAKSSTKGMDAKAAAGSAGGGGGVAGPVVLVFGLDVDSIKSLAAEMAKASGGEYLSTAELMRNQIQVRDPSGRHRAGPCYVGGRPGLARSIARPQSPLTPSLSFDRRRRRRRVFGLRR